MKLWPKPGDQRLYKRSQVWGKALWSEPALPISQVPSDKSHHARPCVGPVNEIPGKEPVYWCRSCNRVVENTNKAFCDKHGPPRARYVRRVRDAKTHPVPHAALTSVLAVHNRLAVARVAFDEASGGAAQAAAWALVSLGLDELSALVTGDLAKALTVAQSDDLDDRDHLVK